MSGNKNNTPALPAQRVGGQRRKLVRRHRATSGPSQSGTMSLLNPGSAATSLESGVDSFTSGYEHDRQVDDTFDQYQDQNPEEPGASEDKMPGTPYTYADGSAFPSPKLTANDTKKKQGLFGIKKPKAHECQDGSSHGQVTTTPLPPSTPSKAARFFGLEPKPPVPKSPHRAKIPDERATRVSQDKTPVRTGLTKQPSLPLLTGLKPGTGRQTKEEKHDAELAEARRGKAVGIKHSPQQTTAATTRYDLGADAGHTDQSGPQETRFRIPAAPQSVAAATKRRRTRKKTAKELKRMSPITEASAESLHPAYYEGEDLSELGIISEYEQEDCSYSTDDPQTPQNPTVVSPQSGAKMPMPPHNMFELDPADLSPTDHAYGEDEIDVVHPGTKVDIRRALQQKGKVVYPRGPLQTVENAYLDATQDAMRLEAHKKLQARVDAEKPRIDSEVEELRRKHENMKPEFHACKAGGCQHEKVPSDGDDDDLVSLRSSIDLNEEPTVHTATLMTITRITPGMVKLVDILPRKKKPVSNVGSSTPVPDKPTLVERKDKGVAATSSAENASPRPINYHHDDDPNFFMRPKKSKLTPEESRSLIGNWVSDYNNTKQRPVSTRIDPDVLADQEIPPAPFPKSDEALLTIPIQPRSDLLKPIQSHQKHQCIKNGHIFHPVDLKTMPDNAVVGSLEVRPYLQTYTGTKQHVKIPILCEKCGEDCNENVWECEIAVCRMAVCQTCAENMEVEWQQRAIDGWKYK
ncbi:hypothetical protein C7974DRAFT_442220 [Boeremia exigua]|uniref:uncharacterized protein n=1 Tax=Boeremia exigua TaxID=749465 RepID=UPI001E8CACF2|nr:uncharacterized protein C7974DRAFT_442220 [Boeremia exigua]KAH6616488.1 hypothetical protein C7974DRAFT_442220 [Boeremia exigua]